jgi:hypothetical protein
MKSFIAVDWRKTLWWLSGSGLPHYLLAQLRQSRCEDVLPPAILDSLSQNYTANQRRVDVMAQEFDVLNRRFSEAGLECAVVRGFELAPEYCSDLSLRTWYTHEYFLPAEKIQEASRVVEEAGYPFRRTGSRGERCFAVSAMQPPSRVEESYTATFPRMVVLHWQMWDRESTGIDATMPKGEFQRLVMRSSQGVSFPTLADDDLLVLTLLDTFVRVLSYWCKLSWILEISNFMQLRSSDAGFWKRFYARIADCGQLPTIADFMLLLCSHIFGVDLPEFVRSRAGTLKPALAIWVQHYGREWALTKYPGSKLALLVQHELISDQEEWKEIQRRKLFPFLPGRSPVRGYIPPTNQARTHRRLSRVFERIWFHGPATFTYLRELRRWNRLLAARAKGRPRVLLP